MRIPQDSTYYHHSNWWPHKLVVDGLTYLEENKMNYISLAHNGQVEIYGSKNRTLWMIHLCSVFIWLWWWSVKVLVAHKDLQENFSFNEMGCLSHEPTILFLKFEQNQCCQLFTTFCSFSTLQSYYTFTYEMCRKLAPLFEGAPKKLLGVV